MPRATALGKHCGQLRRAFLARPDRSNEVVKLHPVAARRPADELERLVGLEPVSLRDDPLGLLDRHAGLKCVLELRAALVGGLGHREEPADRSGRFLRGPPAERLDAWFCACSSTFAILRVAGPALTRPSRLGSGFRSTTSSHSSASAMRSSVSIRGGLPPRSSRAIADCVVPTSSASSRCDRALLLPALGHLLRNSCEEPASVGRADSLLQALEGALLGARHRRHAIRRNVELSKTPFGGRTG